MDGRERSGEESRIGLNPYLSCLPRTNKDPGTPHYLIIFDFASSSFPRSLPHPHTSHDWRRREAGHDRHSADTSCTDTTTTTAMLPALLAVFATLIATILLLLASLSVPIIKSIALFDLSIGYGNTSLTDSGIDAVVQFGIWGYCRSAIQVS